MVLANLIGGFVVILVGVTLMPVVADLVFDAGSNGSDATNVTGATLTITNLVVLFYALGVMSAGISLAVQGLKQAGLV